MYVTPCHATPAPAALLSLWAHSRKTLRVTDLDLVDVWSADWLTAHDDCPLVSIVEGGAGFIAGGTQINANEMRKNVGNGSIFSSDGLLTCEMRVRMNQCWAPVSAVPVPFDLLDFHSLASLSGCVRHAICVQPRWLELPVK